MDPLLKEPQKPVTQDEIARRAHETELQDRRLFEGATRTIRYFADAVGRATGVASQAKLTFNTARGWLMRGFSEREIVAHVDVLMAEMKAQGREAWEYPSSLSAYRAPEKGERT
jgi:hypothetical protein